MLIKKFFHFLRRKLRNMDKVKELKFTRIRGVKAPTRATPGSAGIDLYVPYDLTKIDMNKTMEITKCNIRVDTSIENGNVTNIVTAPGESCVVPSGIKVNVPEGYVLKIENRSSVAARKGLLVGACVIDSDYTGEILVNFHNPTNKDSSVAKMAVLCPGDKMCQAILYPIETPEPVEVQTAVELFKDKETVREAGSFGSTDKKPHALANPPPDGSPA